MIKYCANRRIAAGGARRGEKKRNKRQYCAEFFMTYIFQEA